MKTIKCIAHARAVARTAKSIERALLDVSLRDPKFPTNDDVRLFFQGVRELFDAGILEGDRQAFDLVEKKIMFAVVKVEEEFKRLAESGVELKGRGL